MSMNFSVFLFLFLMCEVVQKGFTETSYNFENLDMTNMPVGPIKDDLDVIKKEENSFMLNKFYDKTDSLCERQIEKYENLLKTIDNYIQRYVSLFLISSKLHNYEIHDSNEIINADLELFISSEDLAFLQEYSRSNIQPSVYNDLSKVDDIFAKSIKIKEKGFLKKTLKSTKSFFNFDYDINYEFSQFIQRNYVYFVVLSLIIAVNWFFHQHSFRKFSVIVIIMNSLILWEGFCSYWKKLKEADLENYVRLQEYKGTVPPECDFENRSWFSRMYNSIWGNTCLQYYKTINQNSLEEVSFLDTIVSTYAFYLIQTPVKIFGISLKDFTGEISSYLPFPINKIVYIPLSVVFVVIFLLFGLILCGKRLKLSYFGCSVQVEEQRFVTASTSSNNPGPIQGPRKVRGLITGKHPRRLYAITAVRRRKNRAEMSEVKELQILNADDDFKNDI